MNRRRLLSGLFALPFAPIAAAAAVEPAAPKRKVTRIIFHHGKLSDDAVARIQQSFEEAQRAGKVIVLEEGMQYAEFFGEPGPVQVREFASGGIVPAGETHVIGERCNSCPPVEVPSKSVGEMTVTINVNTDQLELDLKKVRDIIRRQPDFVRRHLRLEAGNQCS